MGRPRTGWVLRPPKPGRSIYTVRFTNKAGTQQEFSTGESDAGKASLRAAEIYASSLTAPAAISPRLAPHLPLDEQMAQWLASLETTHDEQTIVTYAAHARRFVAFFGNSLARITSARMGDYARQRLGEVLRITVTKERSTLNGFLAWCVEQGLLAEAHLPRWPRMPKKATGVRVGPQRSAPVDVTPAQVNAFLAALPLWSRGRKGQPAHAIRARFIVMYETGLRPATLDELEVPKHWRPGATEIAIEDKIDKARFGRRVPISARAAEALERTVLAIGLTSGRIFDDHDYRYPVERARIAAGLPEDFAPYDLRHGRAGHLLDAGGEMRAVAHILGHKRLTTTDRYLRAQEGSARAALAAASIRGIPGDNATKEMGTMSSDAVTAGDDSVRRTGLEPVHLAALVPESNETHNLSRGYETEPGQIGSENAASVQGIGGAPGTTLPDSVVSAARYLAALRVSEEGLDEWYLAASESGDDEDGGRS